MEREESSDPIQTAPIGQWISAPDALQGRPTLQSGHLLFAVGACVALVYALTHAAATTLLSPVRTVFNEAMPGQYTVDRHFDVAADALASITTWDLSRTGASEIASMYPIHLSLGLNPVATQVSDAYGPLAFPATQRPTPISTCPSSWSLMPPPFKPHAL